MWARLPWVRAFLKATTTAHIWTGTGAGACIPFPSRTFVLSNYLDSSFEYVFFTSVVLTDPMIRESILKGITAKDYETIAFTLTCSEESLKKRHDKRGDKGETNYYWLHLPPCPGDIVINTDNKYVRDIVREMKKHIDVYGVNA